MPRVRIRYEDPEDLDLLMKALARSPDWQAERASQRAWGEGEFKIDLRVFHRQLADHLDRYRAGGFRSRAQAEWHMKATIRQNYLLAFWEGKIAAGGYSRMGLRPEEDRWLKKLRYDEFRYLRGFLDDIDAGRGKMPYAKRMGMYADALQGPYWAGWVLGNRDSRRRIVWVYEPEAEHCTTCLELDGHIWTGPAFVKWVLKTGILPGQGTFCLSQCRCHLEERFV